MPRNIQYNPQREVKLYVLDILEWTFFLGLVWVVAFYGIKHLKEQVPQPWWMWALVPIVAIVIRVSISTFSKKDKDK